MATYQLEITKRASARNKDLTPRPAKINAKSSREAEEWGKMQGQRWWGKDAAFDVKIVRKF